MRITGSRIGIGFFYPSNMMNMGPIKIPAMDFQFRARARLFTGDLCDTAQRGPERERARRERENTKRYRRTVLSKCKYRPVRKNPTHRNQRETNSNSFPNKSRRQCMTVFHRRYHFFLLPCGKKSPSMLGYDRSGSKLTCHGSVQKGFVKRASI